MKLLEKAKELKNFKNFNYQDLLKKLKKPTDKSEKTEVSKDIFGQTENSEVKPQIPQELSELFKFLGLAKNEEEAISLILQWSRTNLDLVDFIKANTNLNEEQIAQTLAKVLNKPYQDKIEEKIVTKNPHLYLLVGNSGKTYSFINAKADVIIPKTEYLRVVKEKAEEEFGTETSKYFAEIIDSTMKKYGGKVSDIKFSPEFQIMNVYALIVGEKEQIRVDTLSKDFGEKVINYLMVVSGADPTVKDKPQSAKLRMEELGIEARLEFIPSAMKGVACVARLFPLQGYFNKTLKDLNLEEKEIVVLRKHALSRKGLIIVNGETSSGKSTTIRAMIMESNPEKSNVWTAEQPVEVVMKGVNHVEVKENIVSFADAIRSFMRVNPKIIFVGEVRDSETAKAVLDAVSTGHMVFTTLHTKDNPSAILRFASLLQDEIENMEFVYSLIADTLALSINQRLVITKDGKIKPILSIFEPDLEDRKLLAENRIIEIRKKMFEKGNLVAKKVYSLVKRGLIEPEKYIATLSVEERAEFIEWLRAVINGDLPLNGRKPTSKEIDTLKEALEEVQEWEEKVLLSLSL
jgi:type II secretory ATPase GspE/PulE/Tfp pilus assembly ATPase PilB-like protein